MTGDAASMDLATTENLKRIKEIGTELLKKTESRVNLETGQYEQIDGGRTNEAALARFAKLLSDERKHRLSS